MLISFNGEVRQGRETSGREWRETTRDIPHRATAPVRYHRIFASAGISIADDQRPDPTTGPCPETFRVNTYNRYFLG